MRFTRKTLINFAFSSGALGYLTEDGFTVTRHLLTGLKSARPVGNSGNYFAQLDFF
jgi:hypothetical protein